MITDSVIVVRLLLSFVSGLAIGLERSSKLQAAGLRTHTLICVGATGVMLLSPCVSEITGDHIGDPGRIAAQVVSGMGFLGGGAILKMGANVKGLTTATTIWVTAGIGLVIGAGLYSAGAMLVLLVLITLAGLDKIEKCVFPTRQNKRLEIQFSHHEPEVNEVMELLRKHSIIVISTNFQHSKSETSFPKLVLLISVPQKLNIRKLNHEVHMLECVQQFVLQETL